MSTASSGNHAGSHFDTPIAFLEMAWLRSAYAVLATSMQPDTASANPTIKENLRVFIGSQQVISRGRFHQGYSRRTSASNSLQDSFFQMIVRGDLPVDPLRSQQQNRL